MKNQLLMIVRYFCLLPLFLVAMLTLTQGVWAIPNQGGGPGATSIPKQPDPKAMARGEEAALDYVDNYGDLTISVIAAGTDARGIVSMQRAGLIDAINTELQSQFRKYTAGEIDIIQPEFGEKQVARILARQNAGNKPDDAILQEMVEMSSAPYVLFFAVGADNTGVKEAGIVTIRFIEVATGRVLFTVSDQFWQDRQKFPNVPTSAWVQHSVTYWMNEVMDELNFPKAFSRFRAPLEFVGDLPEDNLWLREAIAEASGIDKDKINPRRMRVGGSDKVTLTLRLEAPPHTVMDEMTQKLQAKFKEKELTARPLRQDGGSVIFGVSSTPMWWVLTDKKDSDLKQEFTKAYKASGSPNIAVLSYISPLVHRTAFDGSALAIGTAGEGILADLGASVIGVGTSDKSFADARTAAAQGRYGYAVRQMLPENLRERTQWVMMIEIVPTHRDKYGYKGMATARLIDLQQDRVVAAAIFPSDDSTVTMGEAKLEPHTHASRYLAGTLASAVMSRQNSGAVAKTLDVVILNAPSFEFVNRVDNIVQSREGVTETVLPTWDANAGKYSLEARYLGETKPMVERLRADLAALPLKIQSFDNGQITLRYDDQAAAP